MKNRQKERDVASPTQLTYLSKSVEVVETRGCGGDGGHHEVAVDGTGAPVAIIHVGRHVTPPLLPNSIVHFFPAFSALNMLLRKIDGLDIIMCRE